MSLKGSFETEVQVSLCLCKSGSQQKNQTEVKTLLQSQHTRPRYLLVHQDREIMHVRTRRFLQMPSTHRNFLLSLFQMPFQKNVTNGTNMKKRKLLATSIYISLNVTVNFMFTLYQYSSFCGLLYIMNVNIRCGHDRTFQHSFTF